MYYIGLYVGKIVFTSIIVLFEWIFTLKGRYTIGNVGKTAFISQPCVGKTDECIF